MSTYTFLNLVDDVLEYTKKPLSEKEIWEKAVELGLDKKLGSTGKTPWKTISARLYVDIRDNENSKYTKIGKRPIRFYLKEYAHKEDLLTIQEKIDESEGDKKSKLYNERDLHPLLVKFINEDPHFKAYAKTIYHEKSIRRREGVNKWLHPDIVAVYFPFIDFEKLTTEAQRSLSVNSIKLFSFELKIDLDFSKLREYYFQAVSNSSWANEGYLVCLNIQEDSELINELQRLNSAFGIGVIKLNSEDVSQSEIILTAREKTDLDWTTIDRLIADNEDFKKFFTYIVEDLTVGKIKSNYDIVKSDVQMEEYLISKGFKQL